MTGYINVICESLWLSIAVVFFLIEDCKDKKWGFIVYFILELVDNYILLRVTRMTEAGIALPQVVVWRIVLYIVYITFRIGWFREFAKNYYRDFLLSYFYLWISTYVLMSVVFAGFYIVLSEELAVDVLSAMPKTFMGLILHQTSALLIVFESIWIKRRNWIQKLSTHFLSILFAFVFVFADVGSTFLLAKPYIQSITYIQIILVNVAFLLIASYFGYINYLKTSAQKEKEKIQKAIEKQFRSYEALSRKENEIRRIRHDLANHLQIIKEMKGVEGECFSERYQEQLRGIYEEISRENEPEMVEEDKKERLSKSAAWGIFTVFAVDLLMVIIVSQLVLNKVFTYESIIVMQFSLILFVILHVWLAFRRTKKMNRELSRKVNDNTITTDMTKLLDDVHEIISNLETISVQEEEEVLERLDSTSFAVITGNQVLDSMLWHKSSLCSKLSVVMEMEWNLPEDIGIEDMDMIGLAGNLLDNAIEACSRVKGRERLIQVKSNQHANIMSIRVRNTKNESEEPVKNQFRTIKSDAENHGIGMQIIRSIVEKYDGTIQYYDEKTELTIIVNLQV